jgi:hypothetical protein
MRWVGGFVPSRGQCSVPSACATGAGKSQSGRSFARVASSGVYAYGEMPAFCTMPSQSYRAESVLVLGGPIIAAPLIASEPAMITITAARSGAVRSSKNTATNSSQTIARNISNFAVRGVVRYP